MRRHVERVAELEARRQAVTGGPDADILAALGAWWATLTDAELEWIASRPQGPHGGLTREDAQAYRALQATCERRLIERR